jgi:hypothetical protein
MSPLRRHKRDEIGGAPPDSLDAFLAQPADEGTSDADVAALAKADADRAAEESRLAPFITTEEILDRNAPRPSVRD